MRRLFCLFVLLIPTLLVTGCGGTAEEAPPTKAPEMTAEEKKSMEDQVENMRKMRQK